MERRGRIAIGALLGAVVTLVIHPLSQRFVLSPYRDVGPSVSLDASPWLAKNLTVLPDPQNTLQASLWMQVGAEMLTQGRAIGRDDLESLIAVATAAARGDPDNAFWPQMKAVFLWDGGQIPEAVASWKHAATAIQWNDYQSRRLEQVRNALAQEDGGNMSWQFTTAYYQRSLAPARTIEWVARLFFQKLELPPQEELSLRVATVRNGRLLRDGSRSVAVGGYGANLVEYSCAPLGATTGRATPREQILSLDALIASLRKAGMERDVLDVDEAFRTNDAWFALTQPTQAVENARRLAGFSILSAVIPGLLFGMAAVGVILWFGSWLFDRFPKLQVLFGPPYAPVLGVVFGVALYLVTGLVLAAITVSLCFGFLSFEPSRIRKKIPDRMRFGFRAIVRTLAVLFVLMVGGFWAGLTTPAEELVPHLGLPMDLFGGNTIFLSLAVLVLSLLLLTAPSWAIVERIPTPIATVRTLREFASFVVVGGLIGGILATPAAVYADSQVQDTMSKILANEPAHYLLQ